jgi:hypothetical protein
MLKERPLVLITEKWNQAWKKLRDMFLFTLGLVFLKTRLLIPKVRGDNNVTPVFIPSLLLKKINSGQLQTFVILCVGQVLSSYVFEKSFKNQFVLAILIDEGRVQKVCKTKYHTMNTRGSFIPKMAKNLELNNKIKQPIYSVEAIDIQNLPTPEIAIPAFDITFNLDEIEKISHEYETRRV